MSLPSRTCRPCPKQRRIDEQYHSHAVYGSIVRRDTCIFTLGLINIPKMSGYCGNDGEIDGRCQSGVSGTYQRERGSQTLLEHLEGTAELAERFGAAFGSGDFARMTALAHDLGSIPAPFSADCGATLAVWTTPPSAPRRSGR